MNALRAQLSHVSRFSAVWLPRAETSLSSAGVVVVLIIPLALGFHCLFGGCGSGGGVGERPKTEAGLRRFKGSYYCLGVVTLSAPGLRQCRSWCEIQIFSYRQKWPNKGEFGFIPTRKPGTVEHHCCHWPTSGFEACDLDMRFGTEEATGQCMPASSQGAKPSTILHWGSSSCLSWEPRSTPGAALSSTCPVAKV